MTFAQYIVFIEEMYESAVNNNAEDFPKVTVDTYSTVVIGVKFVSTFVDWGDQSLVPNIGEDARAICAEDLGAAVGPPWLGTEAPDHQQTVYI